MQFNYRSELLSNRQLINNARLIRGNFKLLVNTNNFKQLAKIQSEGLNPKKKSALKKKVSDYLQIFIPKVSSNVTFLKLQIYFGFIWVRQLQ